jgi:hypothetical protein
MRSLESFLLQEALLKEAKEKNYPEGFTKFPSRGRITNQLKELLNIKSASDLNLKSTKANKILKIATKDGQKAIIKDLGISATTSFSSLFKSLATSGEMRGVFTGTAEDIEVDGAPAVKIKLANGFEALAGKRASTLKFIKFWCTSTCIAAGMGQNKAESFEYLENDVTNEIIVVSQS